MTCYTEQIGIEYSSGIAYFRFSIGKSASRVWWTLVEDQSVFPPLGDGASALGWLDPDNADYTDYPGPVLFSLDSSIFGSRRLAGFVVDDRGDDTFFYILTRESGDLSSTLYKFNESGSIIASHSFVGFGGLDSVTGPELVGLIDNEIIVSLGYTDYDQTRYFVYKLSLGLGSITTLYDEQEGWLDAGFITPIITGNKHIWLVEKIRGTFSNWSAIQWDSEANIITTSDTGIDFSYTAFGIGVKVDCTATNLVLTVADPS